MLRLTVVLGLLVLITAIVFWRTREPADIEPAVTSESHKVQKPIGTSTLSHGSTTASPVASGRTDAPALPSGEEPRAR
jgi:hypothetical protein